MLTDSSSQSVRRNSTTWWRLALKYGVPPLITVGLCWLLFTDIDFGEMIHIIRTQCHFGWLAAGLVVSVFSHVFRALRWRIQLNALHVRPPLFILVLSIFGTYAVNLVLPRLGELWRTGYISARQQAPFSTVFGSMICDRLSDTLTVLLLTLLTFVVANSQLMSYLQQNPEAYSGIISILRSPWLWISLAALTVAVVVIVRRYPQARPIALVTGLFKGIWQGFAVVITMPGKGMWLLYTLLIWGCYFLQLYLAFFAFPVTAEVALLYGPTAVLVCFVLSSLSMAVPSNGGIGPWQWAIMFGLSMYASGVTGLTKEYATTFANTVMGCQTIFLILLGIFTFIAIAIDKRHTSVKPQNS